MKTNLLKGETKKMKKSKILAMIMAIAMTLMVIAIPVTVSASPAPDGVITVKAPASLALTASDFSAYKLFDVTVSGTAPNINYAYTPVAAVSTFMAVTANATKYGTDLKAYLEGTNPDLTQLTKDLQDSGLFTAIPAAQSGTDVVFNALDYGYYMVVGMGKTANNVSVVAHNALVTVDALEKSAEIDLKADAPSITKEVYNHNTSSWDNKTDVNVGGTADFRLTSTVPDMTGYTSYQYTVRDIMSKGLTFNNDVTVSIGGTTYAAANYTVTQTPITAGNWNTLPGAVATDAGSTYIVITFAPDQFVKLTKGAAIEILYSGKLNDQAVMAPGNNPNTAWLSYSNNPYTTGTGDTAPTTVYVYTYQIDINKIANDTDKGLGNAVFNLRTTKGSDATNIKVRLVTAGDSNNPSVYIVDSVNGSFDITTPDSGLVEIQGLDTGTYFLVEKTAPNGYSKLTDEIQIDVTATYSTNGDSVTNTTVSGTPSFVIPEEQVINYPGDKLPGTGGIGVYIFYAVSALITIGLIAFFVIRRRTTRNNILNIK